MGLLHTQAKQVLQLAIHKLSPALARSGMVVVSQQEHDALRAELARLRQELTQMQRGLSVGPFLPTTDPAAVLSSAEVSIVEAFHNLYYQRWQAGHHTITLAWLGYETLKCPLDLWIYQEIISKQRPDFIIETGTCHGGSAYYLASLCHLLGHGQVITIDCAKDPTRPQHERITYLDGMSTSPEIRSEVERLVGSARNNLVILDSDHSCENVLAELQSYRAYVPVGGYLIVEDTSINGHPTYPEFGPGPTEAVQRFLIDNPAFVIDASCERFMMTLNPGGYLRRVAHD